MDSSLCPERKRTKSRINCWLWCLGLVYFPAADPTRCKRADLSSKFLVPLCGDNDGILRYSRVNLRRFWPKDSFSNDAGLHSFVCCTYVYARRFETAVSEDEVMMPHAFERLWGAFEPQGEFQTHITESVPQTTVVRHLNDRGFQVTDAHPCLGMLRMSMRFSCVFLRMDA